MKNPNPSSITVQFFKLTFMLVVSAMSWCDAELLSAEFKLDRYEAEIRRFETEDAVKPPSPGAILFTGSSSVVKWSSLSKDFSGLPVLNRGFGGSTWRELNHYFLRVVPQCRPRAVVVYEGDNDLAMGRTVEECVADFEAFRSLMKIHLPGVPVAILAVKPSPSRRQFQQAQERLNSTIRERVATAPNWEFLDVASVLVDDKGQPQTRFFENDQLHLNREGYALWVPVVRRWAEKFGRP